MSNQNQYEVVAFPDPDNPGKTVSKADADFEEKKERWEEKISGNYPPSKPDHSDQKKR